MVVLHERDIVCGSPDLGLARPVLRTMSHMLETGVFWYGDNLEVMREHLTSDGEVDLIYLDPPFNSKRAYNSFFTEADASVSRAQLNTFEDYWRWGPEAEKAYGEIQTPRRKYLVPATLVDTMQMLRRVLGDGNMMAYLSMMAVRLIEMKRLLKSTGSLYLHCDPTASHYIKLVLDALFGIASYRNEIVWLRSKNPKGSQHGLTRYSPFTDTIFYYTMTDQAEIHLDRIRVALGAEGMADKYPYSDEHGPYADGPILRSNSMGPRPNLVYEYKGFTPGAPGWRVERQVLEEIDKLGNLNWTKDGVRRKLRPEAEKGSPVGSFWGDIPPINSQARERIGYPTQKPLALLERIVAASSNPGDLVLDPFCGCGTAVVAAQGLGRKWIGIDVTHLAVGALKRRMDQAFPGVTYRVRGEPGDAASARQLAEDKPLEFQAWIVDAVGGIPVGAEKEKKVAKAGGDDNRDGILQFQDDPKAERSKRMLISVKAGESYTSKPEIVDALGGAMKRHGATLGALLMSHKPSDGTYKRAAGYGTWASATYAPKTRYPAIQIVTVDDIFAPGWRGLMIPGENTSLKSQPPPGTPGASGDLFDEAGQPAKRPKPKAR